MWNVCIPHPTRLYASHNRVLGEKTVSIEESSLSVHRSGEEKKYAQLVFVNRSNIDVVILLINYFSFVISTLLTTSKEWHLTENTKSNMTNINSNSISLLYDEFVTHLRKCE